MRHLIIYTIILLLVAIYTIYKAFEFIINLIPEEEEDTIYYQMDMFRTKRLLLNKISFK